MSKNVGDLFCKFFESNLILRNLLNNSFWVFLDKLIRMGLGVLIGAWIARHLGPEQFGELAYVLAYVAFFQSIANLGLDGITVREISKGEVHTADLLGTVFLMRFCAGILCWLTVVISLSWFHGAKDNSVILAAIVAGVLVFQAADTIDLWFQSQSQSKKTTFAKILAYFVSSGCKIVLIFFQAPLLWFAFAITIEAILCALGLMLAYQRFKCGNDWQVKLKLAKRLTAESWPFIISSMSTIIYMRIDQIMIKEILGSEQLGIYAAVLPLAMFWQVIPMIFNTSLTPFITRKKNENENIYWEYLAKIFSAYALLAWLAVIVTIILANWLVPFLYGEKYIDGILILSIYAFTNIFINMGIAQSLWILNENKSRISLINSLVGAFVCVLGNWILIPRYGVVGVAVVAVFSMGCSTILTNVFFSRKIVKLQLKSILFLGIRDVWKF